MSVAEIITNLQVMLQVYEDLVGIQRKLVMIEPHNQMLAGHLSATERKRNALEAGINALKPIATL